MGTKKITLNELRSLVKQIIKEESGTSSIGDLYKKYGKEYPYGADAVAYYIFGDKSDDNILIRAYKGVYGRGSQIDSSEVSSFMLDNEYYWEENISEIDEFIKNIQTNDGSLLSDYF